MTLDLRLRDVVIETGHGRRLLEVKSLDVPAGSRIGIRGPSGAGKSTLLYAIAGLLRPARGTVVWGDETLSSMRAAQRADFRRRNVGLIFQDFLLFEELSAFGNAAVAASYADAARRPAIADHAEAMLRHLGLGDHAGRDVETFSGGERQRVAVSRALANDPGIILADEPTASLDRPAADRLVADLAALAAEKKTTLIAVSHDPALHAHMDEVIDVMDGRIASEALARR